ncbi:hypothetical protein [Spirochaeta cellobiosiphila]|uniref:hypothetical protein n=1 Tax=Spirochaeta cellobiosiphila TaxID=504483 RepID=UPI00056AC5EB|nr:hypothetical protein [Spirochaeta cellobiosiphila]
MASLNRIIVRIQDEFSSVWTLLGDTTMFLSSLPIFNQFERRLRNWRWSLEQQRNNPDVLREIRKEVIDFRNELRKSGYDISLGSYRIKLEGFRHDDCMAEGFKRMVMYITPTDIYYLTGTDNHINLASYLDRQLINKGALGYQHQQHYLWFKWHQKVLILSGAASEPKESFEQLHLLLEKNPMFFIKRLKKLN